MNKKKPIPKQWIVVLGAIAGIVIMECTALNNGINGTVFSLAVAAVAGLGGYLLKSPIQ